MAIIISIYVVLGLCFVTWALFMIIPSIVDITKDAIEAWKEMIKNDSI